MPEFLGSNNHFSTFGGMTSENMLTLWLSLSVKWKKNNSSYLVSFYQLSNICKVLRTVPATEQPVHIWQINENKLCMLWKLNEFVHM